MASSRPAARDLSVNDMCILLQKAGIVYAASPAAAAAAVLPTYSIEGDTIVVGDWRLNKHSASDGSKRWIVQKVGVDGSLISWDLLRDFSLNAINDIPDIRTGLTRCSTRQECGYAALVTLLEEVLTTGPDHTLNPGYILDSAQQTFLTGMGVGRQGSESLLDSDSSYSTQIAGVIATVEQVLAPLATADDLAAAADEIAPAVDEVDSILAAPSGATQTGTISSASASRLSSSGPDYNSDQAVEDLLTAAGYANPGDYIISLAQRHRTGTEASQFYQVVASATANITSPSQDVDFILNTADNQDVSFAHFVHLRLSVENGKVNRIVVFDSQSVDDREKYKDAILQGLGDLADNNVHYEIRADACQPLGSVDCPYYAVASLLTHDRTNTNTNSKPEYEAFRRSIQSSYLVIHTNQQLAQTSQVITTLTAAQTNLVNGCKAKIDEAYAARQRQSAAPASTSTPSAATSTSTAPATSATPSAPAARVPSTRAEAVAAEKAAYKDALQRLESYNRLLLAYIAKYKEIQYSGMNNTDKQNKLAVIEGEINAIKKIFGDNKLESDAFKQAHPGLVRSEELKLEKIIDNAIMHVANFESLKARITAPGSQEGDFLLHASILDSKFEDCPDYATALAKAKTSVSATSSATSAGGMQTGDVVQKTDKNAKFTVFEMAVTTQQGITIHAATVRSVDKVNRSIKSDYYFSPEELAAFKDKESTNSALVELVAQKIKNHRAPMDAEQLDSPMKLNIGAPRMPENIIKAHILYCAYKGYELTVPYEYKKYQEDIDKKGFFGKESLLDNFAKAWKEKHQEDIGVKEQRALEAAYPRTGPRR